MKRRDFLQSLSVGSALLLSSDIQSAVGQPPGSADGNPFAVAARAADQLKRKATHMTLRDAGLVFKMWFVETDNDVMLLWQPTDLGGPYPGGTVAIDNPRVTLRGEDGTIVDLDLLPDNFGGTPKRVSGVEAYRRVRGMQMARLPWTCHFAAKAGRYQVTASCLIADLSSGKKVSVSREVGQLTVTQDCLKCRPAPINELAITEPDRKMIESAPVFNVAGETLNENHPAKVFASALDNACRDIDEWGSCPWGTESRPERRLAPSRWNAHERSMGFYLTPLSYAFRATGRADYYRHALYCQQKITGNIWPAPWGGYCCSYFFMHEVDSLLHAGIQAQGILDFYQVTGDRTVLEPTYRQFKRWPRDQKNNVLANEINPIGQETHPGLVYNQVTFGLRTIWQLGRIFDDPSMMDYAKTGFAKLLLPDMHPDGYWVYGRGGKLSTHYDLLQKSLLGDILWDPQWRKQPGVLDCALRGARFCVANVTKPGEGELIWDQDYGSEKTIAMALGKAGMASSMLAPLVAAGHDEFRKPLVETMRFIYNRRKDSSIGDFWRSSWMMYSVLGPLFRVAQQLPDVLRSV